MPSTIASPLLTARHPARTLIRTMRPRLLVAVLFLCCATALLAQTTDDNTNPHQPPAQATPRTIPPKLPPATASISGTVFCNDTHRPARGAVVMAQPISKTGPTDVGINANTTRVGMDGTYTLHHLRSGDYTIVAFLPGYLSPLDDVQVDEANGPNEDEMRERLARNGIVSVRDNETARMDVTLTRGATVSGRVLFDDGVPATQVILSLEDVNAKPAPQKSNPDTQDITGGALVRGLFLHQSQGTDDQGNFRISGIKPGSYRLAAVQSMESLADNDGDGLGIILGVFPDSKTLRVYGGDTFHKNAAKKYELRAGDEVNGIEITIPVYAFHRVEGHLSALDGRQLISAGITLADTSDASFILHARLAPDGSFVFPQVPSGTYKLVISNAKSVTVRNNDADSFADLAQLPPSMLQNVQSFADRTTTVLVKDSDVTDISIQLQSAAPAANQPTATPAASSQ